MNVTVLEYTAFNVFATLYAGLWFAALVVTAYPAGLVVTCVAVVSALYPSALHPVPDNPVVLGAGKLTAVTALSFVL